MALSFPLLIISAKFLFHCPWPPKPRRSLLCAILRETHTASSKPPETLSLQNPICLRALLSMPLFMDADCYYFFFCLQNDGSSEKLSLVYSQAYMPIIQLQITQYQKLSSLLLSPYSVVMGTPVRSVSVRSHHRRGSRHKSLTQLHGPAGRGVVPMAQKPPLSTGPLREIPLPACIVNTQYLQKIQTTWSFQGTGFPNPTLVQLPLVFSLFSNCSRLPPANWTRLSKLGNQDHMRCF